jgi:hypothetical protein
MLSKKETKLLEKMNIDEVAMFVLDDMVSVSPHVLKEWAQNQLENTEVDNLATRVLEDIQNVSSPILEELSSKLKGLGCHFVDNLYEHYQQEAIRKISSRFSLEQVEALAEGRANIQMV